MNQRIPYPDVRSELASLGARVNASQDDALVSPEAYRRGAESSVPADSYTRTESEEVLSQRDGGFYLRAISEEPLAKPFIVRAADSRTENRDAR